MEETWNRKTAQCIQMAISQNLHQTLGVEATLPEDTVKELVLQVTELQLLFFSFFFVNIRLSIVVFTMRPQSLKMTIHPLYRAYDGSRLAVGCRRQQPNIKEKGSSTSTSPLLDQTHGSSLIFLKVCLGMQT